jgi:hypothetical protein
MCSTPKKKGRSKIHSQNQSDYHLFIDTLFTEERKWKRYSNILTNDTKFNSNNLKMKYQSTNMA